MLYDSKIMIVLSVRQFYQFMILLSILIMIIYELLKGRNRIFFPGIFEFERYFVKKQISFSSEE